MERGKFIGAVMGAGLLAGCAEIPNKSATEPIAKVSEVQNAMGGFVIKCLTDPSRRAVFLRDQGGVHAGCFAPRVSADKPALHINPNEGFLIKG